jgi:hypothetical protein
MRGPLHGPAAAAQPHRRALAPATQRQAFHAQARSLHTDAFLERIAIGAMTGTAFSTDLPRLPLPPKP